MLIIWLYNMTQLSVTNVTPIILKAQQLSYTVYEFIAVTAMHICFS